MKEKLILLIIFILIFCSCVGIGFYLVKINKLEDVKITEISKVNVNQVENNNIKTVNGQIEKVSPNAIIIVKRHYNECGHTLKEYMPIPKQMVNMTKDEVEKVYNDWEIEGFSSNEIIIKKEENGICNEHYEIGEKDNKIVIYTINNKNNKEIYKETDIVTNYLPETDRINLKKGILVNGKEALHCLLEDFE